MSEFKLTRGDLVSGVYRVEAPLGRGGFAEVYRVKHENLNRIYALKLFAPRQQEPEADRDQQERFVREARAIHDIDHPNIVRLHHYGIDDENRPFLVMDYVAGRTLQSFSGQMSPRRACSVVAQVLEALHAVHQVGLLHRDVKPSNVMIGADDDGKEWVRLIDFGVAKHYDRSRRDNEWLTLTRADGFIGTPAYTAPELLLNEDPSPSADIYSAGLVLYELIYGERAVSGENSIEVLSRQLQPTEFELPAEPELPPQIRAALQRMICRDPADRFATAPAAAIALTSTGGEGALELLDDAPVPSVEIASTSGRPHQSPEGSMDGQTGSRRRWIARIAVLLGLAVVSIWGLVVWLGEDASAVSVESAESKSVETMQIHFEPDEVASPEPQPEEPVVDEPGSVVDAPDERARAEKTTPDRESRKPRAKRRKVKTTDRKTTKKVDEKPVEFEPRPVD